MQRYGDVSDTEEGREQVDHLRTSGHCWVRALGWVPVEENRGVSGSGSLGVDGTRG